MMLWPLVLSLIACSSVRGGLLPGGFGFGRMDTYTTTAKATANRPTPSRRIRCHRIDDLGTAPTAPAGPAEAHDADSTVTGATGSRAAPACRSATCNSTVLSPRHVLRSIEYAR